MSQNNQIEYCSYGAKSILKHLERISEEMEPVRSGPLDDIEHLHRMRVATRRIRTGLVLFSNCFDQDSLKEWNKIVKKLTRALGRARDSDVKADFLRKIISDVSDKRYVPGLERLLLRTVQERTILQKPLKKAIDNFNLSNVRQSMVSAFREITGRASLENSNDNSLILFNVALKKVRPNIADILSFDILVRNPSNVEQLHELRKSNKNLRYTLEFFDPAFENDLKEYINSVKNIHSLLGLIHDCDVWIQTIPEFIEEERMKTLDYFGHTKPFGRIRKGMEFLLQNRKMERENLYKDFVKDWDDLQRDNFWMKLQETMEQMTMN